MTVSCSVCGVVAEPSIYKPGVSVFGGNFGKCPSCGKVFCENCRKTVWIDTAKTMWVGKCPNCDTRLNADIVSPSNSYAVNDGDVAAASIRSVALFLVAIATVAGIIFGAIWVETWILWR